jgi:hypothetical protein
VEQIRDGVVRGGEAGSIDFVGRGLTAPHRIAELADEGDVFMCMNKLELFDAGSSRRNQVGILDEAGRMDEVHRELDASGLQWMFIRQVVLHQVVAVNENHRTGHGHLP